jgi:hypothetical protein
MRKTLLAIGLIAGLIFIFSGCEKKVYVVEPDTTPPSSPKGVYSTTGNRSIYIDWEPNDESDLKNYWIFKTLDPDAGFSRYDKTSISEYTDFGLSNGTTYYYVITATDYSGNESEVSKVIYDTPRPEGFNVLLYDMAVSPNNAGFFFAGQQIVRWDDLDCDIYLDKVDTVFYLNATEGTDIQDFGYIDNFDYINVAPEEGWSALGYVEVIPGHTYIIWTWDNHFAKLRVTYKNVYSGYVRFDWAYQTAVGNPELKVVPKRIANRK